MKLSKRSKFLLSVLLTSIVLIAFAGCGGSSDASSSGGSGNPGTTDGSVANSVEGYPAKNIEIVLPYGPGSSTEAVLRAACEWVENDLGFDKKFIITNKEGGSGEIGLTYVYNSDHDGYTLATFHTPHIALKTVRGDECPFSYEDFKPIVNFNTDPNAWLINSDNADKYPNMDAVIEAARANPGGISVACGGLNTSEGRMIKQIERDFDVEFKIVPIDNDAEFVATLRGGHTDALVTQIGDVMGALDEGAFIALAVGTPDRVDALPDVPTFKEEGFDFEFYSMRSLAAPAGIPDDIYEMLCDSFARAMQSEEVLSRAADLGMDVDHKTPEEIYALWENIFAANEAEWAIAPW